MSFHTKKMGYVRRQKCTFQPLHCWSLLYCLTLNSWEIRNSFHMVSSVRLLNFNFPTHKITFATSQELGKQQKLSTVFQHSLTNTNCLLGQTLLWGVGELRLRSGIAYTQVWPWGLLALHKIENTCVESLCPASVLFLPHGSTLSPVHTISLIISERWAD